MYPFMTLPDGTEIVHSELRGNGTVKVYIEKPDEAVGFRHMTCYLPSYTIEEVSGFSEEEVESYLHRIRKLAHLIMELAQEGDEVYATTI